jgi:hypothetical protein
MLIQALPGSIIAVSGDSMLRIRLLLISGFYYPEEAESAYYGISNRVWLSIVATASRSKQRR